MTYRKAIATALLISVASLGPVGCTRSTHEPIPFEPASNQAHALATLPADAFPIPPWCMTEDEGMITQYEDGSILIRETGCKFDPDTREWR